jgi:hypothetical protein
MIEAMYGTGVRTFVEVGPGARLSGLVRAILADRDHTAIAVDSSNGKRSGIADLARTLAQLAALGHDVRLSGWDEGYAPALTVAKPAMTVPICGANYRNRDPRGRRLQPLLCLHTSRQPPSDAFNHRDPAASRRLYGSAPGRFPRGLSESLRMTRESMAMLLRMQEDTAQIHRRFLEGQETAARTFQTLLEQQQRIFHGPGTHLTAEMPRVELPSPSQQNVNQSPVTSHQITALQVHAG